LLAWVLVYLVELLFWVWIIGWGGAKWLEGTFASGFLISYFAPSWSAEGIKLFAWVSLLACTIWFVVGIFNLSVRFV